MAIPTILFKYRDVKNSNILFCKETQGCWKFIGTSKLPLSKVLFQQCVSFYVKTVRKRYNEMK